MDPEKPGDVAPAGAENGLENNADTPTGTSPEPVEPLDLDAIERDLAGVETALERLDDGSYWIDEITGEPIPDSVLTADPIARRS